MTPLLRNYTTEIWNPFPKYKSELFFFGNSF
jgi:hypothetical protein